jgi:hypothetical protein
MVYLQMYAKLHIKINTYFAMMRNIEVKYDNIK